MLPATRAFLLTLLVLVTGCLGAPVGTKRVGARSAGAELEASALTGEEPSAETRGVLWRRGVAQAYERDPIGTLRRLHAEATGPGAPNVLFALAELSYLTAERGKRAAEERRALHLSAATYGYLYLLTADPKAGTAFDRRLRIASGIYNLALARAFSTADGKEVVLASGTRDLLVGQLDVAFGKQEFAGAQRVVRLLPADDYAVRGVANRHRASGLGAPMIGVFGDEGMTRGRRDRVAKRAALPLTALLRVDGTVEQLSSGTAVPASLELLWPAANPVVGVGAQAVPLETDLTAPLAYHLQEARSGALMSELRGFFGSGELPFEPGLYLLEPYRRGKTPVVLIHGTASSPARWADLLNELYADPVLRERHQFWMFVYQSGAFIPASALVLRDSLRELHHALDAGDHDPALDRMVLIGHSQGGLLARMQVTSSDEAAANAFIGRSLGSEDFTPAQRDFLRRTLEFDAVPFVSRVVFVCTPQQGSVLAESSMAKLVGRLVDVPKTLVNPLGALQEVDQTLRSIATRLDLLDWNADRVPTSLTQMTPGSPFLAYLNGLPFAPDVSYHSIIASSDGTASETANDGVVAYRSAHLPSARSEVVVRSGHSAQGNPEVIAEVRRILLEHCGVVDPGCRGATSPPRPGAAAAPGVDRAEPVGGGA